MEGVEIGKAISQYGDVGALTILVGLMVWYLKYQTKRQATREDKQDIEKAEREKARDQERKEESLFIRGLLKNDLKELHQDSVKNADLNKKSITLQKSIANQTIGALNIICDRLNGGNSKIAKIKDKLKAKADNEK